MIAESNNGNGTFSADVQILLYVADRQIELGQLGPGFALLRDAQAIDGSLAEIETIIDGKTTRFPIRLTSTITGDAKRFTFESL